ncbi:MAG: hypothetical protein H6981_05445 [Gammaproteobacteria bacterium]|nr:hypothetical protein [Gammaproteobacteria bacterium]MCP5136227.1 hypothetical protein [Gammaproteobacteria bacterium]
MSKYIQNLVHLIAYAAYIRMYGIHDRPIGKIEVHLSKSDNDWNSLALSSRALSDDRSDITIKENQPLKITNMINTWNQLAIAQKEKSLKSVKVPNNGVN